MKLPGDNPIHSSEEDTLGRAEVAKSFVRSVTALDVTEGTVVGVLGAWGSGKTSFVNLARAELARAGIIVLDFNPWMFSGTEQLVESFFVEVSAQLKLRPDLAAIGQTLDEYGEALSGMGWLPLVGPWIERARAVTKVVAQAMKRRREGADVRRRKLHDALARLAQPLCIVLDDIDRLSTSEIRDVFRLVRLTASFPNVIYVVAFDRARVENALAEQGITGREYLEKILQLAIDLPCIPEQVLLGELTRAIGEAAAGVENPGPFDVQAWPDVLMEVIRPLVRNMRDVKRYAGAARWTIDSLDGQIELVDVLALEAVRVFLPDVFARLHGAVAILTSTDTARGTTVEAARARVEEFVKAAERHEQVARALIERIFPAANWALGGSSYDGSWQSGWLRARRAAHGEILHLYLERVAGQGLRIFKDAEKAWALLDSREQLEGFLRSLGKDELRDVIASLEAYEESYKPRHVVPGVIVLLNALRDLPDRIRGLADFGGRVSVARVVLRLLRSLGSPEAIEIAVGHILPELRGLSERLELIRIVGHRENIGLRLVTETVAASLEREWRDAVRRASVDDLIAESNPMKVLLVARKQLTPSEDPIVVADVPALTLALLRDAQGESLGQFAGNRAVTRTPYLAWDALVELFGDEATLGKRVGELKAVAIGNPDELMALVDRYLSGWRPED